MQSHECYLYSDNKSITTIDFVIVDIYHVYSEHAIFQEEASKREEEVEFFPKGNSNIQHPQTLFVAVYYLLELLINKQSLNVSNIFKQLLLLAGWLTT